MPRPKLFDLDYVAGKIGDYIAEHGMPPTVAELRDALGVGSTRTAVRYLGDLEAAGMIERWPGARGIRLNGRGTLSLEPAANGFLRGDFTDANGDACSIQESSAMGSYLWLGQNSGTHHMGRCLARMHLSQEHVRELLPLLQRFAETGSLAESQAAECGKGGNHGTNR